MGEARRKAAHKAKLAHAKLDLAAIHAKQKRSEAARKAAATRKANAEQAQRNPARTPPV